MKAMDFKTTFQSNKYSSYSCTGAALNSNSMFQAFSEGGKGPDVGKENSARAELSLFNIVQTS